MTLSDPAPSGPTDWSPGLAAGSADETEVQRLAATFAVTPQAARQALERVGADFQALQRELGGRR